MAARAKKKVSQGNGCLASGFFLLFAIVGGVVLWFLALKPWLQVAEARSWSSVPCVIQKIEVKVHDGSDGDTYSPDVLYDYAYQGQTYTGDQFWFGVGSYGSRSAIEAAIAPFASGGEYNCFVNPKNPQESVLTRQVAAHTWLGWLLGGIFLGVGLIGFLGNSLARLFSSTRDTKRPSPARDDSQPRAKAVGLSSGSSGSSDLDDDEILYDFDRKVCPVEEDVPDEPLVLKPEASRVGKAVGVWIFGLIWNSIIGGIFWAAWDDLPWFPMLFLGAFLLIGILIFVGAVYATMQIWNPKTTIVCSQRYLYPGSEFEISWLHQGKTSSIRQLQILLEGEEKVSYRQGTSTRTETQCFYRQTIVQTEDPKEIEQGFCLTSLPVDTMHTFNGSNNWIAWHLKVKAKIPYWPDTDESYDIVIYPPRGAEANDAKV